MKIKYVIAAQNLAYYALAEACCENMHHKKSDYHKSGEKCKPLERLHKDIEIILGKPIKELMG